MSISVAPHRIYFVNGITTSNVQDLKGLNLCTIVEGMGMVEWTVSDVQNSIKIFLTMAFDDPDETIQLFSP
jgi:hypothetical protein